MNQVYQDITQSDITYEVDDIVFYFSSLFNKNRFIKKYEFYVKEEENKIINKFHFNINLRRYLLLSLYNKIEIRGFLVEINKKLLTKDDIVLSTSIGR